MLALTAALSAHAEEPRTALVGYQDLDLRADAGTAALYSRIRRAALAVCRPEDSRQLARYERANDCYAHAVAAAVKAVHNERLSAYHWQKIKHWNAPAPAPALAGAGR